MFSLHNIIQKINKNKILSIYVKNKVLNYINFLVTCVKFGFFFDLKHAHVVYHNIFVYIYLLFARLQDIYFKVLIRTFYDYFFILVNQKQLKIQNFYISKNVLRTKVEFIKFLYKILFLLYSKKNNDNNIKKKIKWYFLVFKILIIIFKKVSYIVIFETNYFLAIIIFPWQLLHFDFLVYKTYWSLRYIHNYTNFLLNKYEVIRNIENFVINYYFTQTKPTPYILSSLSKIYLTVLKVYNSIKTIVIPGFISVFMLFVLINFFKIELYTNVGIWGALGFFFLWLMSGFNFFIKRYKNGKFTGAIQRFWKRTNSYFWLIEGFLFTLFFYYYLNSSQEPLYMYDESNFNQTFLPNLFVFYFSLILLIIIIFYCYYLMLNLATFSFKQQLLHLVISSVLMIYIFLLESYQFYYLINTFFEITWFYLEDINAWVLESENPKIRVKTQYLTLALIAKYWHFIFIFFSWLFLLYKSYERKKIYYSLFGFVIQNCIILVLLNLLFCVQWLKWLIRRYYDVVYYWFFIDSNGWVINDFTESFIYILGF